MKPTRIVVCLLILSAYSQSVAALGYATRDLNPILQSIYLPAYTTFSETNGYRLEQNLLITNTLQVQARGDEELVIDVENYRYELGLRYRQDNWFAMVNLPFVANTRGELDYLIEGWHDLFGLSQGKREEFRRHQIEIEYQRGDETLYLQDRSSSGIADVSFALGYKPRDSISYFVGIELPTGSASAYSGNRAIDVALWLSAETKVDASTTVYGLLGISFPGDEGNLKGLLQDQVWVAQIGLERELTDRLRGIFQLDLHGETLRGSRLRAFDSSLQLQLGLGILGFFEKHRLDLFFSEDILIGSAPDISMGARLVREF